MSVVDTWQTATEHLAGDTQRKVAAVYAALQDGQVSRREAEQLIAAIINHANASSVALAEAGIIWQVQEVAAIPVPALGVAPLDDHSKLVTAARTVLAASAVDDDPLMRLQRLARSEPLHAGHRAASEVMSRHKAVEGWTRQMEAGACQLCRWWWRDGRVWPAAHPFQSHQGCNCQPKVVVAEHIKSTGYTRRLERNG